MHRSQPRRDQTRELGISRPERNGTVSTRLPPAATQPNHFSTLKPGSCPPCFQANYHRHDRGPDAHVSCTNLSSSDRDRGPTRQLNKATSKILVKLKSSHAPSRIHIRNATAPTLAEPTASGANHTTRMRTTMMRRLQLEAAASEVPSVAREYPVRTLAMGTLRRRNFRAARPTRDSDSDASATVALRLPLPLHWQVRH